MDTESKSGGNNYASKLQASPGEWLHEVGWAASCSWEVWIFFLRVSRYGSNDYYTIDPGMASQKEGSDVVLYDGPLDSSPIHGVV